MVHEVNAPLYYVLRRGLEAEQIEAVQAALSITPCHGVVISDLHDEESAWRFAPIVLLAANESRAIEVAKEWADKTGRPLLVIGKSDFLHAVYSDGHSEPVFNA